MLAQVPNSTPTEFTTVVLGLAGIAWILLTGMQIIVAWKKIGERSVPAADQFVTHAQLDSRLSELKQEIRDIKQSAKEDADAVSARFDKQDRYLQESFHRIGGANQTLLQEVAWITGTLGGKTPGKP